MFGQMPAWLHRQSTKKEKNRRKVFRPLFDHYLGAEHVTHQANKVEARIANLSYKGEQKNWGWDKYVDAHIEQHIIAKNLMPYGYSGIDERSKSCTPLRWLNMLWPKTSSTNQHLTGGSRKSCGYAHALSCS